MRRQEELRTLGTVDDPFGQGWSHLALPGWPPRSSSDWASIDRAAPPGEDGGGDERVTEVSISLHGRGNPSALTAELARIPGVLACAISHAED